VETSHLVLAGRLPPLSKITSSCQSSKHDLLKNDRTQAQERWLKPESRSIHRPSIGRWQRFTTLFSEIVLAETSLLIAAGLRRVAAFSAVRSWVRRCALRA
jgi:hypothetical protein